MKVLLVANPFIAVPPLKYGGTEQIIYYLIKHLKQCGHEPILLGAGDSTVECEVIPIVKKALSFPKTAAAQATMQLQIRYINQQTRRKIRMHAKNVDIIHSHGFDMTGFEKFPNVTTLHGPIIFENLKYYLKRKDLNYISISKNQQEALPDLNFVGTAYNGEEPKEFPSIKKPKNYVCFLGRFDHEKNPHLAIQLAITCGIKIKLAGKIDYLGRDYFKKEIKPYINHHLVEFLGELNFEEKVKLVSHAKCNLHPTGFREPFGLSVLEAAYCGTPTLAISRGSMPELIEEGKTGMLVEDFIEGFSAINRCFEMDREYIAKRARRLFNAKNMTNEYLEIYKKVIHEHTVPSRKQNRLHISKFTTRFK